MEEERRKNLNYHAWEPTLKTIIISSPLRGETTTHKFIQKVNKIPSFYLQLFFEIFEKLEELKVSSSSLKNPFGQNFERMYT